MFGHTSEYWSEREEREGVIATVVYLRHDHVNRYYLNLAFQTNVMNVCGVFVTL